MNLVNTTVCEVFLEGFKHGVSDFFGRVDLRKVGSANPRLSALATTEAEVADSFATDQEVDDVFTLLTKKRGQLLCFF